MRDAYPAYPVTVQSSPDDMLVLCVRVFAVPENQIDEVQDFIFDLQDSLITKTEFVLLPMIKSIEVTRQYYPKHLLSEPSLTLLQTIELYLFEKVQQPSEWQHSQRDATCVIDYRMVPTKNDFNMHNITGGELTPVPKCKHAVSANDELAFAA